MGNRLKRFVCIVCAAILCSLLPANAVLAEEHTVKEEVRFVRVISDGVFEYYDDVVETTYETHENRVGDGMMKNSVSTLSIEDYDYYCDFTTFEDLQQIVSSGEVQYEYANYTGEEPLVISSDLKVPDSISMMVFGEIIVPEGVTFTAGNLEAHNVTIEGTANVDGLYVEESLTVNGSLNVAENVGVAYGQELIGEENIHFGSEWSYLYVHSMPDSIELLKEIVASAAVDTNPRKEYSINLWNSDTELVLNESLEIPENVYLDLESPITITEGTTLTINDYANIHSTVRVEGTLCCKNVDSWIDVWYDHDGRLDVAESGSFTGKGILDIYSDELTDISAAIPGMNTTNLEITEFWDYSHFWRIRNISGLTKLANPTDLEWGYERSWDGSSQTERSGMMSWKTAEPDQGQAIIRVYKEGVKEPYQTHHWDFGGTELPEWRSIDSFIMDDPESGTYYFTVTSEGDYISYCNSDPVASDTWTYTKPSAALDGCANLSWDWPNVDFELPDDKTNVGGYEIDWYYAANQGEEPENIGGSWNYDTGFDPEDYYVNSIGDWFIQDYGTGFYYFRVRALTSDITKICNSEWSELSPAFNLTTLSEDVESQLGDITSNKDNMSAEEILNAVQSVDTEKLESAMLADSEGTGVMADLTELEEKVGGPAPVEVAKEATAFDADKISIVGANLNNAASAEPIKLVIDKPEKDHVIDTRYESSVAVKFSMDLENVEDSQDLDVPVKVTLPVPNSINPSFLVVLHYHTDGTMEELDPHVYKEGGQTYASFVLTSFSDFIMTQKATTPMYRLYNPNSGEHFYTGSVEERDMLDEAGWNYEGIAWNAPITSGEPVHRLFNPNSGDHHYTMSAEERDMLVSVGWIYEGVCWNSAPAKDNLPLYRLYNPNADCGSHHYTGSVEEREMLVSVGWIYEGIGWYGTLK